MSSVSVIVPCYNYGHLLARCVRAALDQPGVDVNVLIVDDASTDETPEVAARLAAEDARVSVLRHSVNKGHIATYNDGLAQASGDYTVLVSADDLPTPGALRRAADALDARPSLGLVYGRSVYFDEEPLPAARCGTPMLRVWRGGDWLRGRLKDGNNVISSPEVMVRTSLQHELGGYRVELPAAGDLEMWLRFAARSDIGYLRGVDQAYYRVHAGSMQRTTYRSKLTMLEQHLAMVELLFDNYGDELADRGALEAMARRRIAKEALWHASRAYDRRRTDEVPVADLAALAYRADPDIRGSVAHFGFQVRQAVGETVCPYLQPLVLAALWRRLRTSLWWYSWHRNGVGI